MTKRALLVGINEFATGDVPNLRGCVNDSTHIKAILTARYGFAPDEIRVVTNGDATARGIKEGLGWLLSGYAGDGRDVRLFQFSSHGSYVDDQDGDEPEDEIIIPADHDWSRPFRDDDLRTMFDEVPANVSFTFLADCCHSGTIQKATDILTRFAPPPEAIEHRVALGRSARVDGTIAGLPAQMLDFVRENPNASPEELHDAIEAFGRAAKRKLTSNRFGLVSAERHVLLAACQDRQSAADARLDGTWQGAFTWSLLEALSAGSPGMTHAQLLKEAAAKLDAQQMAQIPQLECPDGVSDLPFLTPFAEAGASSGAAENRRARIPATGGGSG